jgi:hypothetical protein
MCTSGRTSLAVSLRKFASRFQKSFERVRYRMAKSGTVSSGPQPVQMSNADASPDHDVIEQMYDGHPLPELAFSLALAIRLGTGTREISERSGFQ